MLMNYVKRIIVSLSLPLRIVPEQYCGLAEGQDGGTWLERECRQYRNRTGPGWDDESESDAEDAGLYDDDVYSYDPFEEDDSFWRQQEED